MDVDDADAEDEGLAALAQQAEAREQDFERQRKKKAKLEGGGLNGELARMDSIKLLIHNYGKPFNGVSFPAYRTGCCMRVVVSAARSEGRYGHPPTRSEGHAFQSFSVDGVVATGIIVSQLGRTWNVGGQPWGDSNVECGTKLIVRLLQCPPCSAFTMLRTLLMPFNPLLGSNRPTLLQASKLNASAS